MVTVIIIVIISPTNTLDDCFFLLFQALFILFTRYGKKRERNVGGKINFFFDYVIVEMFECWGFERVCVCVCVCVCT